MGHSEVASALGAERLGEARERGGGPLALFALRQDLAERLRSTGGRRSLEGTTRRQKIPIGELDWLVLEYLASHLRSEERRPTASQVASALLRRALGDVDPLRRLAGQVPPRLREPSTVMWLFAQAVRRNQHFVNEADAREHLLADARAQAEAGEIGGDLVRRLKEADLPKAYAHAMEAALLPLERAEQELISAAKRDSCP